MCKLICDNCGELDYVTLDGYNIGEKLLEGVKFKVWIKNGAYRAWFLDPDDEYLDQINKEYWIARCIDILPDMEEAICPLCGSSVGMPFFEEPEY